MCEKCEEQMKEAEGYINKAAEVSIKAAIAQTCGIDPSKLDPNNPEAQHGHTMSKAQTIGVLAGAVKGALGFASVMGIDPERVLTMVLSYMSQFYPDQIRAMAVPAGMVPGENPFEPKADVGFLSGMPNKYAKDLN